MVVKFENLATESYQLLEYLSPGLSDNETFTELLDHYKFKTSHLSDSQLTKLYFQQLSDEDVEGLKKYYQMDFEIFGYEKDEF